MASIPPTNTNSSPEAISCRGLPWELRQLIYPHALELQPCLQAPPLLLALASEPYLHSEALEVLQTVNFVLTLQNDIVLRAKKAEELLKIRNLTVIWDCELRISTLGIDVPIVSAIETLYGSNNLETITFDLRKAKPFDSFFIDPWVIGVRNLIIGAKGSVHKATIVVELTDADYRQRRRETRLLQILFVLLGVPPKQEESPKGITLRIFTWEGNGLEIMNKAKHTRQFSRNSN